MAFGLVDAGPRIAQHNFGLPPVGLRDRAGSQDFDGGGINFADDFERLLRLAFRADFGEQLIKWFETTGFADKLAPIYVALKAYVRGERALLDANPETQGPARIIQRSARGAAARQGDLDTTSRQEKPRRGRPRKETLTRRVGLARLP